MYSLPLFHALSKFARLRDVGKPKGFIIMFELVRKDPVNTMKMGYKIKSADTVRKVYLSTVQKLIRFNLFI